MTRTPALAFFVLTSVTGIVLIGQSAGVYVNHDKVSAVLAKEAVLIRTTNVTVAAARRDADSTLPIDKGTSVLYVVDGAATLVAGDRSQRLAKGDVVVIGAGVGRSLKDIAPAISYYLVSVPLPGGESAQPVGMIFVDHAKVAATLKKAGPLADGPGLRVSGGYRTGPYAPEDYRPDVEVHATEGDLFYVIEGDATLVTGGAVLGGRTTAPGQIRGSTITGGETHHLTKGDVMWVPAGVPHWFPQIPKPLSYLLVKTL
jgi:quercetin dioxygenase-like cupin family protein